jgi:hypothetical protein
MTCTINAASDLATDLVAGIGCTTIILATGFDPLAYDETSITTPRVVPSVNTPTAPLTLDLNGQSLTIKKVIAGDAGIEVPNTTALTIAPAAAASP